MAPSTERKDGSPANMKEYVENMKEYVENTNRNFSQSQSLYRGWGDVYQFELTTFALVNCCKLTGRV